MFNIPRLYQGIVSKESLDKLYAQAKTYFPGPVPDMSNSIGLIPHLRSSCYTDVPFIVSGQSKKSMSGKNSVRAHQGDLRREPSLPASTFDDWTETIPRYWSAPTIWAETAYKAAQRTNQIEILKEFDYHWLYASCFAYSKREYYPLVFAAMFRNKSLVQKVFTLFTCTWLLCRIFLFRVGIFVRKYIFGVQGKKFETIAGALHYLETKLDQENILSRLDRTLVGL